MVYMLFDNPADKQNMTFLGEYAILPKKCCKPVKK